MKKIHIIFQIVILLAFISFFPLDKVRAYNQPMDTSFPANIFIQDPNPVLRQFQPSVQNQDIDPPNVIGISCDVYCTSNLQYLDFSVTFSESVMDVDAADFVLDSTGITGASITNISSNGANDIFYVTIDTGTGDGTLQLNIPAEATINDLAGNPMTNIPYSIGDYYSIDKTAPSVNSILITPPSTTTASTVNFYVTFSEPVTVVEDPSTFLLNATGVSGSSITSITDIYSDGTQYIVTVATGSGDGTLGLDIPIDTTITDFAGNLLSNLPYTGDEYYTIEKRPWVTAITITPPALTNAANLEFSVIFSEPVTGVDTDDFVLDADYWIENASIIDVTGMDDTWTVTVNTGIGNGAIGVRISDTATITDMSGLELTWNDYSVEYYQIDKTPPEVGYVSKEDASPTGEKFISYSIEFSEEVTGVGTTDFNLISTGITGARVTSVSGTGTSRTITIATGTGSGTIDLRIPSSAVIKDIAGNQLIGLPYTAEEPYIIDKGKPKVVSIKRYDYNPTYSDTVTFHIEFSRDVTGVDIADFMLVSPGLTNVKIVKIDQGWNRAYVTVSTGMGSGTLRLDIPSSATIKDTLGNPMTALPYTAGEYYVIDRSYPRVTSIQLADPNPTSAARVRFTVNFSEPVSGVDAKDFYFSGYGLTKRPTLILVTGSGASRTVTVSTDKDSNTLQLLVYDNDSIKNAIGKPLNDNGTGSYSWDGPHYTINHANTFTSSAVLDGWVLESSEFGQNGGSVNSTSFLYAGDDILNRQYRTILHFNTSTIPARAQITKVTLVIRKAWVEGSNPFDTYGKLTADIATGFFGSLPSLQVADFQSPGIQKSIGSFTPVSGAAGFYQLVLTPANYLYINRFGPTQFRLRFAQDDNNNLIADYIAFHSGNSTSTGSRPTLKVEYILP
jgi:hypothetical protein